MNFLEFAAYYFIVRIIELLIMAAVFVRETEGE